MFLECPAAGMEGRTDPAIYPPLLHVLFTCALLNNNPLAFCAVFFKFQVVAVHLPFAPIKEKLDQLPARSFCGLVVKSRRLPAKRHSPDVNQPLVCPHVCFMSTDTAERPASRKPAACSKVCRNLGQTKRPLISLGITMLMLRRKLSKLNCWSSKV